MNTNPQTNISNLMDMIGKMNKTTSILPFNLMRAKSEAKKLLKTDEPYQGYLCLAALSVFDQKPIEDRLAKIEEYLSKVRLLPHDVHNYFTIYCNCLVRLGERERAYLVVDEYVNILTDNVNALRGCLEYTRFTGQIMLSEKIMDKLNKLGKDMMADIKEMQYIKTLISEPYLKELLVQAGKILRDHDLINYGSVRQIIENEFFYELTVLPDSDENQVAICDIELSRLKIRFAREKGLDLSKFVLGCAIGDVN